MAESHEVGFAMNAAEAAKFADDKALRVELEQRFAVMLDVLFGGSAVSGNGIIIRLVGCPDPDAFSQRPLADRIAEELKNKTQLTKDELNALVASRA